MCGGGLNPRVACWWLHLQAAHPCCTNTQHAQRLLACCGGQHCTDTGGPKQASLHALPAPSDRAALPTLDINEGALNNIMAIYKRLLPGMGGWVGAGGPATQATTTGVVWCGAHV